MKLNRRKSILALLLAPFGFKAAVSLAAKAGPLPLFDGYAAAQATIRNTYGSADALQQFFINQEIALRADITKALELKFEEYKNADTKAWINLLENGHFPKGGGEITRAITT